MKIKKQSSQLKVAYLGPFTNQYLRPYLPTLTDEDVHRSPGMGGYGLVPLVLERLERKLPTVLITLDNQIENERLIRRNANFEFYSLPRRKRRKLLTLFKSEKDMIQDVLEASKPDVIHAHWTYEYALAALTSKLNIPVLVTVRDHTLDVLRYSGLYYLGLFFMTLWVYRKAKYMSAVSPHPYALACKLSKSKVWMIENVMLKTLFRPTKSFEQKIQNGKLIIVAATLWDNLKNPKAAIKVFHRLYSEQPNFELHLCGPGMEPNGPAAHWAFSKKMERGIVFEGNMAHESLIDLLEIAVLYLHTSRTEACNTAIAEAMALGVPVIGRKNAGGVPWQLNYGRAGILVDFANYSQVAKEIKNITSNPADWDLLSKRSRERAISLYDGKRIFDEYEQIYQEMLNG